MKSPRALVFGTFDILHLGHKNFFQQARQYGRQIMAVVARDKTVAKLKKRKSLHGERVRLANLKKTSWADQVILGHQDDKYLIIKKLKPDIICLGYDQTHFVSGLRRQLKKIGLNTRIVRLKPYQSRLYKSSKIRQKLYA